jgi:hypothetical protein
LIRPKRIYFPEHFCCFFSPNLCVLNTLTRTNAVFSRIALVSCFCAEIQLSGKNPRKYCKNPILPEDPQSQNKRWRGARRAPHHLVARPKPGHARGWCGRPSHLLDPTFCLHIPSNLKLSRVRRFSQIEFRCAATIRNHDSEPETPFWHPAGTGIWRRSSSSSSPTSLRQPSMIPPSMCE